MCYGDNVKWDVLKDAFQRLVRQAVTRAFESAEAEQHVKYLSFPFWEDRKLFEG
jgi:hypothetical protein